MSNQILVGCSGGGGDEVGLAMVSRSLLQNTISVEEDPGKPLLSVELRKWHDRNLPETTMFGETIEDFVENHFDQLDENMMLFAVSPPCQTFSVANMFNRKEKVEDVGIADAIAQIITQKKPLNFFLENVPGYAGKDRQGNFKHQSFQRILAALDEAGYVWEYSVEDVSEYGVPTARKRLILRATRMQDEVYPLPRKCDRVSWLDAVSDLIWDENGDVILEQSPGFTKGQVNTLENISDWTKGIHWIDRVSVCGKIRYCNSTSPLHTFTRQMFNDGKGVVDQFGNKVGYGNSRNRYANVIIDGIPYKATARMAYRIQGFPDWYEFPVGANVWGSILGNSVPPLFAKQVFGSLFQWMAGEAAA